MLPYPAFRAGDRTCWWGRHFPRGIPGEAPQPPLRRNHQVLRDRDSYRRHFHHVLFLILS